MQIQESTALIITVLIMFAFIFITAKTLDITFNKRIKRKSQFEYYYDFVWDNFQTLTNAEIQYIWLLGCTDRKTYKSIINKKGKILLTDFPPLFQRVYKQLIHGNNQIK